MRIRRFPHRQSLSPFLERCTEYITIIIQMVFLVFLVFQWHSSTRFLFFPWESHDFFLDFESVSCPRVIARVEFWLRKEFRFWKPQCGMSKRAVFDIKYVLVRFFILSFHVNLINIFFNRAPRVFSETRLLQCAIITEDLLTTRMTGVIIIINISNVANIQHTIHLIRRIANLN